MSKLVTFLLGIVAGLLIGGFAVFFYLGGAPRASETPGRLIQPPDPNGTPGGTAQIVLRQEFFNTVLQTIFRDMNSPSFPIGIGAENHSESNNPLQFSYGLLQETQQCTNEITLLPEGSNVQTALSFADNKITMPLAFKGSNYITLFGCVEYAGWAQANLELRFDETQKTVFGTINVETVNVDGLSQMVSGFVTPVVQSTLNSRVNPVTILRGDQIRLNIPIAATGGNLQAQVKDVRAEVKDNALNLYVIYDFAGTKK